MTHIEKAEKLLHQKYHCSQALFGAFASDFGLDLKTAFKISTCFGGGMRQGGVCGCITASLMVLGLAFGFYDSQDTEQEIYGNKKTEEFIRRFTEQMEDRAGMARKTAKNSILGNIVFYEEQFKDSLYNRKFIEENGFIRKVDYYIWEEACRFIRRCQDEGLGDCPISVNVSRAHLRDNECIMMLDDMITKTGIPRKLLELEITETVDDQQVSSKAFQLKEEGFTLLMDDFGSGYSSLNILLETPFDVIKLDKKFMENMMVSAKGRLILEQVVSMANRLGLGLLAEGVETKEQVELLQNIGCDQVQGYYYAKPMAAEDFFTLLKKQNQNK